jgi:hypothetical protein
MHSISALRDLELQIAKVEEEEAAESIPLEYSPFFAEGKSRERRESGVYVGSVPQFLDPK